MRNQLRRMNIILWLIAEQREERPTVLLWLIASLVIHDDDERRDDNEGEGTANDMATALVWGTTITHSDLCGS